MTRWLLLLVLLVPSSAAAQDGPSDEPEPAEVSDTSAIYTATGAPAGLAEVVAAARQADAVLFGEQHDDAAAHALQRRLLQALVEQTGRPVILSLEMFERDVQPVLDEYLAGLVRERDLLAAARPWGNYADAYRPLVEYAKAEGRPVVAANAPGRYVSLVGRAGPEALLQLPETARAWLPPLPVAPPSERLAAKFTGWMEAMAAAHGGGHGGGHGGDSTGAVHGNAVDMDHLLAAQNLRDATMGHAIAETLKENPGALVLHLNGTFHSEGALGVPEHLLRYAPGTRVLTLTAKPGDPSLALDPERFDGGDGFRVVTRPGQD
ncbi:MAG: ChaN family lipoprotein [Rhodothermales bacterium]|nr:ChaN family lipoprotein [Rhodothermales bacterium]